MPMPRLVSFPFGSGTLKPPTPLPREAYTCPETTGSLGQSQGSPDYHPQTQIREEEKQPQSPLLPQRACKGEMGGDREETPHHWFAITGLANVCHSEGEGQPPCQLSHCPGDRSPCVLSPGYSLSLNLLVLPSRNHLLDI